MMSPPLLLLLLLPLVLLPGSANGQSPSNQPNGTGSESCRLVKCVGSKEYVCEHQCPAWQSHREVVAYLRKCVASAAQCPPHGCAMFKHLISIRKGMVDKTVNASQLNSDALCHEKCEYDFVCLHICLSMVPCLQRCGLDRSACSKSCGQLMMFLDIFTEKMAQSDAKKGSCPANLIPCPDKRNELTVCSWDAHCSGGNKCCRYGCHSTCLPPCLSDCGSGQRCQLSPSADVPCVGTTCPSVTANCTATDQRPDPAPVSPAAG